MAPKADSLLLPEGTNLIHLGPTKTGSTHLQHALFARQAELLQRGICYPGTRAKQQYPIAHAMGWGTTRHDQQAVAVESEIVARQLAEAAGQQVCLSYERLARAQDAEIPRLVERFGGDRPHVVAVARRYDRYLPSEWQQNVKQMETRSYQEWLELILGPPQPTDYDWNFVWRAHDTGLLAARWGEQVGLENMTVVVGSETDHGSLMHVFEGLLGLPEGFISEARVKRSNQSHSYDQIELFRRLNRAFGPDLPPRVHLRLVRYISHRFGEIQAREHASKIPALPEWARGPVVERSERRIEQLRTLEQQGLRIVGDLDDLRVPEGAFAGHEVAELGGFASEDVDDLLSALAKRIRRDVRRVDNSAQKQARLEKQLKKLRQQKKQLKAEIARLESSGRPLHRKVLDRLRG